MNPLGEDIVKSSESELVLSSLHERVWKIPAVIIGFMAGAGFLLEMFNLDIEELSLSTCGVNLILGIAAAWLFLFALNSNTRILFNQPVGYLTINKKRSVILPLRETIRVPLPRTTVDSNDMVSFYTYPVKTTYGNVEFRTGTPKVYGVNLPLEDGRNECIWTTYDENTIKEVTKRLNQAILECNPIERSDT